MPIRITSYAAWAILIIPTMPLAPVHILPVFMGLSITAAILRALADRLISGAPPSTRMLVLNRCRDANYPMPALLLMVLATVKDLVILSVVYAISVSYNILAISYSWLMKITGLPLGRLSRTYWICDESVCDLPIIKHVETRRAAPLL